MIAAFFFEVQAKQVTIWGTTCARDTDYGKNAQVGEVVPRMPLVHIAILVIGILARVSHVVKASRPPLLSVAGTTEYFRLWAGYSVILGEAVNGETLAIKSRSADSRGRACQFA